MKNTIVQICALSVFCGVALCLTPEGSVKKAANLCCLLLLLATLLTAFRSLDYDEYALNLARYREMGSALADDAQERKERLNRQIMELKYEEYIRQQALTLGIKDPRAEVTVRWDTAGVWVPGSVRLSGDCAPDLREKLESLITAELGIDGSLQEWVTDET